MKTFRQHLLKEEYTKVGSQLGSNPGGQYEDSTGKKFYIKHYANPEQAKVEALTGKIYNHMGIKTINPEYTEVGGKPSIATEWNDKLGTMDPSEFDDVTPKQAEQLARMYHGAVLTKNWDIVGLEHDNIMKHNETGDLHAVDHGGAFHFRARGGPKEYGDDVAEHESLINNDGASGEVFRSVFRQHPEAELQGLEAVKNIDDKHIRSLFLNSGLSNADELYKNFMARKRNLIRKYQ